MIDELTDIDEATLQELADYEEALMLHNKVKEVEGELFGEVEE